MSVVNEVETKGASYSSYSLIPSTFCVVLFYDTLNCVCHFFFNILLIHLFSKYLLRPYSAVGTPCGDSVVSGTGFPTSWS